VTFRDGLGERRLEPQPDGTSAEILTLRRELSAVPSFEFALRERATRLAGFHHSYYARVRSVDRLPGGDRALTVTADAVAGIRLSELLSCAHERGLALPIDTALCLLRQVVPAVAILHESVRDAAHGALAPERLILGPNNRVIITEYVLGSALEQVLYSRERYWTDLRIALPRVAGLPRFDHLADVTQLGVIALQLVLGRLLQDDEYPGRVGDIVAAATVVSPQNGAEPLAPAMRTWITRALQLDPRRSFPSAIDARSELERAIAESGYEASPAAVDAFVARYQAPDKPVEVSGSHEPKIVEKARPEVSVIPTVASTPTTPAAPSTAAAVATEPAAPVVTGAPRLLVPRPVSSSAPDEESTDAESASVRLPRARARGPLLTAAAVALAVVLAGGALVGARRFLVDEHEPAPTAGTLTLTTNPAGADAMVDGVHRGMTPVTLSLAAGSHKVELRGEGEPRVIPITMTAGAQMSQYVELPRAPAVAEPVIEPPAAVPAPPPPDGTLTMAGWVIVRIKQGAAASGTTRDDRLDVDVYEGDRLVGNSRIDRIMLPVGRHELDLVNATVGLRLTRTVQVSAGKVSQVIIDRPTGTMAVNATPWAEVWVDGEKAGETPIGNLVVPVGSHTVVFRHPELGERRQSVVVMLSSPARVSADLRAR
jgi:hypothetical protein